MARGVGTTMAVLCFAALQLPAVARGVEPSFGRYDIPTVFFISKSDDRNRVDYGMRLDEHCAAVGNDAVFPYWREFEHGPPVRTHALGAFEYLAYGISTQGAVPSKPPREEYLLKLKRLDRRIWVSTSVGKDGRCHALARTAIAGIPYAELLSVYVKLSGPLSVAYIDVSGRNLQTGTLVRERIK